MTRRAMRPAAPHRLPTLERLGHRRWATGFLDRLQPELTRYPE